MLPENGFKKKRMVNPTINTMAYLVYFFCFLLNNAMIDATGPPLRNVLGNQSIASQGKKRAINRRHVLS